MKILNIYTGGTISSAFNTDGVISVKENQTSKIIDLYRDFARNSDFDDSSDIEFCELSPYTILSENLSSSYLLKLIECLKESLKDSSLDGIIIAHGTDTLQYTASILSYIFCNARIPIVLVSADFVMDDPRSNAIINFTSAVNFIRDCHAKNIINFEDIKLSGGVFVSYCNVSGYPTIHLGSRLSNPVLLSADLDSVLESELCIYTGHKFKLNPNCSLKNMEPLPLDIENIRLCETSDSVLRLRPYPGFSYDLISDTYLDRVKVVLHETFHAGTCAISPDFIAFTQKCKARNIPIYISGLNKHEKVYETSARYQELSVEVLEPSSTIGAYCKLWLALSNDLDIREVMRTCYSSDWV